MYQIFDYKSASMSFSIRSETGILRKVLLGEPDYYEWLPTSEIAKESLARSVVFDRSRAIEQHRQLRETLVCAGVECLSVPAVRALPDLCWTRDSSQVTPWGVVITRLSAKPRQGEGDHVARYYHALGAETTQSAALETIEGGDIHIIHPGLLLVGISSKRTSRQGALDFARTFVNAGWEVRLIDVPDRFVHLDVVFSMVTPTLAMACLDVLDSNFALSMANHGIELIDVSVQETEQLGCNLLALGNNRVVVPLQCMKTNEMLRRLGIDVLNVELDMFTLAGGGVRCLTQPLCRDEAPC